MINLLGFLALILQGGPAGAGMQITPPLPPTPAQLEPYGFAGAIFGALIFFVFVVLFLGWKYFTARDRWLLDSQEKRDANLASQLERLGAAHEKVMERAAQSTERLGDAQAGAMREMSLALRDLQTSLQAQAGSLSEERIAGVLRRAVREVLAERGGGGGAVAA